MNRPSETQGMTKSERRRLVVWLYGDLAGLSLDENRERVEESERVRRATESLRKAAKREACREAEATL